MATSYGVSIGLIYLLTSETLEELTKEDSSEESDFSEDESEGASSSFCYLKIFLSRFTNSISAGDTKSSLGSSQTTPIMDELDTFLIFYF